MNNSRMNIIFVTNIHFYKKWTKIKTLGGIETNTKDVIQELRKRGHHIWVVEKHSEIPNWVEMGKVDIIAASTFDPLTFLQVMYYKRKFKNKAAIVIHGHTTVEDLAGNFLPNISPFNRIFKTWLNIFYGRANLLITPSQYSKRCILDTIKPRRFPIHTVSNGIIIENFRKKSKYKENFRRYLNKNYNVPLDAGIILNVGLSWKKKGVDKFALIAKQIPNYFFVWVGPISNNPDIQIAKRLKNVIFTGFYKDIREPYFGSDLFLNTSRVENQGIPLIEAAICELPIIASDLPAYDWLENGRSGIKASTIPEYIDAIYKVMNNPKFSENLVKNAREIAIELHDFSKIGNRIESLYRKAIKRKEIQTKIKQ